MGFGVPVGDWIKESLIDWALSLIDQQRLVTEGYLNAKAVQEMWQQHLLGRYNRTHELWNILMFQSWLEEQQKMSHGA